MTEANPEAMDERARRVGENEVLFREVNAHIGGVRRTFGADDPSLMRLVCECGDDACLERIDVPAEAYEATREHPARFLLVPGHDDPGVEEVVGRHDGFVVVEKREGGPAEFAAAHEPDDA